MCVEADVSCVPVWITTIIHWFSLVVIHIHIGFFSCWFRSNKKQQKKKLFNSGAYRYKLVSVCVCVCHWNTGGIEVNSWFLFQNIFFFIFKLHIHTWHTLTNALTVPIGLFLIITTINSYVQMNVSKTFNDWLYAQLYAHFNTMAILIRFYILWLWWLFESKIRAFVHITTFTAIDFDRSLSWF